MNRITLWSMPATIGLFLLISACAQPQQSGLPDSSKPGPGQSGYCPNIFPACNSSTWTDTDGKSCDRLKLCQACEAESRKCTSEGKMSFFECDMTRRNCQTNIPQD